MEIFAVGKELLLFGVRYFIAHKITLAIFVVFYVFILALVLKGLRGMFRSEISLPIRLCAYAYIVVSVLLVLMVGSACFVAAEVYEANPWMFTTRLYIVVTAVSVARAVLEGSVLKANRAEPDDLWESTKRVLKSIVAIVGSLVFVFTDLEFTLLRFGPTIFHRTVGGWIFNFYSGLAVAAILGLAQFLLTWPLLPWFAVGMRAMDEA